MKILLQDVRRQMIAGVVQNRTISYCQWLMQEHRQQLRSAGDWAIDFCCASQSIITATVCWNNPSSLKEKFGISISL